MGPDRLRLLASRCFLFLYCVQTTKNGSMA
jgi:hypothetical protein